MARSEAQKTADRKYAEKVKERYKQFAVNLKNDEYDRITSILESAGMTKADFLRWAVEQLEKNK